MGWAWSLSTAWLWPGPQMWKVVLLSSFLVSTGKQLKTKTGVSPPQSIPHAGRPQSQTGCVLEPGVHFSYKGCSAPWAGCQASNFKACLSHYTTEALSTWKLFLNIVAMGHLTHSLLTHTTLPSGVAKHTGVWAQKWEVLEENRIKKHCFEEYHYSAGN